MKKIIFALAGVVALASCNKELPSASISEAQEVIFKVENNLDFNIQTKATAVTELNTFNVIAENSTSSSSVWSTTTTKSGSNYTTGKYWPSTDGKYAFYASNVAMTYASGGATISPSSNDTDIVVAYSAYNANNYKKSIALTFDHIYARIGTVSITAPSGYTINVSSVSTSIVKGGTYNVKTGSWTSKGTSSSQTLSVGSNDIYAVPNTYNVTVKYTLTKGDYSKEFTKTGSVTLVQGKINNITATPSVSSDEGASDIIFTVSLTPWGSQNHSITLN